MNKIVKFFIFIKLVYSYYFTNSTLNLNIVIKEVI